MRYACAIVGMFLLGGIVGYATRATSAARSDDRLDDATAAGTASEVADRARPAAGVTGSPRDFAGGDAVPTEHTVVDLRHGPPPDDRRDEPRDERWAVSMETALRPVFARRLAEDYPDASLRDVRCRSSSCTIEYDLPAARAKEIWFYLQLTMPHGPSTTPGLGTDDGSGVVRATFEARYDDEITGGDEYLEWLDTVTAPMDDTRTRIRGYRADGVEWWK